jgi:hypothetical protein
MTSISAASEALLARGVRPPTAPAGESAPSSGVADRYRPQRPTVSQRPDIRPALWPQRSADAGFTTDDPYVRRFWTAAIGPGAVADLMRLAVAAQRDRSLPLPGSVGLLVREDLARWVDGRLFVRPTIPPLSDAQQRRLTPGLRRELHATATVPLWTTGDSSSATGSTSPR